MNLLEKIDLINEIISKDEWKTNYRDVFIKNFDTQKYQEIVKQLTNLFKKLNNGKLKKTLVFDMKSKKINKLREIDLTLINLLLDMGYDINKNMYMVGIVKKNGKEKSIFDILDSFATKNVDRMKSNYEKNRNDQLKKQIDFIENLEEFDVLKNKKINKSKLNIFQNTGKKIVLTYDHKAIASQSTKVGWTSCMNLDDGSYSKHVAGGASDGVFIAYLVKAGDEYTLEHPSARILLKPYEGKFTGKLYWKADKIYGTASDDFKTQVQSIIDKAQGTAPKESDIFSLTDNTYNDTLDKKIINLTDKQEQEIYDNPDLIKNIDNPNERLQLIAVKQNGFSIKYINNPTEKVQLEAVKEDGSAIQHIKNPSEKVQLEAVKKNSYAIQHIKNPTEKIQLEAVKENSYAIQYIKNPTEKIQLEAVKRTGYAIQHIKNPSEKVQLEAVKQDSLAIEYIIKKLGGNPSEKIQLIAVKKNGFSIKYIANPSEKVQIEAVKKYGNAIKYINNPSEKVQIEAVKQDGNAIMYIKNPNEKVQKYVEENS